MVPKQFFGGDQEKYQLKDLQCLWYKKEILLYLRTNESNDSFQLSEKNDVLWLYV